MSVGLCSTSDETISEVEKVLLSNLCPLIKSSYGFAITDKCPYMYFSDLIVGETTCDGKVKMYELLAQLRLVMAGLEGLRAALEQQIQHKGETSPMSRYAGAVGAAINGDLAL